MKDMGNWSELHWYRSYLLQNPYFSNANNDVPQFVLQRESIRSLPSSRLNIAWFRRQWVVEKSYLFEHENTVNKILVMLGVW